jgi:hypothetical protein
MITLEKLKAAGYVQFSMGVSGYALFLMDKRIEDEVGIKYSIHIDVFPAYPNQEPGTYNFRPQAQFNGMKDLSDRATANMIYLTDKDTTIEDVEKFFEEAWVFMGCPYYERFQD